MEKITNVVIKSVIKGKAGYGQRGPWQAWTVYMLGDETKFDYFEKDNIVPYPGMKILSLEYVIEQSGEFTNYKVRKLVPAEPLVTPGRAALTSSALAVGVSNEFASHVDEKRVSVCTSYAKDLMIQLLANPSCKYNTLSISETVKVVCKAGKLMADLLRIPAVGSPSEAVPTVKPSVTEPLPSVPSIVPVQERLGLPEPTDDIPF